MAKTDWNMNDIVTPADMNQIGEEINANAAAVDQAQQTADAAETPSGAQAKVDAHAALTAPHSATSAATANRLVLRDGSGRAKVAAPSASDDIARKAEVDAVQANLTSHVGSGGSSHAAATTAAAGFMSATDKTKLDGIQAGAQVNAVTSVAGKTGVVTLTKNDVGLDSVQNYGIATQVEAEAGTSSNRYMTPQRTMQAIAAQAESPAGAQARVDAHATLTAPHSATSAATANRLALRDGSGNISVGAATAGGHAVNRDTGDGRYIAKAYIAYPGASADGTNFETYGWQTGHYQIGPNMTNMPISSSYWQAEVVSAGANDIIITAYRKTDTARVYYRMKANGTWGSWRLIVDEAYSDGRYARLSAINLFSEHQHVTNNRGFYGRNTSNAARHLASVGSDNVTYLGSSDQATNILSSGTLNHNGNRIWDTGSLRTTNGYLEVNLGGTWLPVGGGVSVASNTLKHSDDTERELPGAGSYRSMIVSKFVPRATGEVRIVFDARRVGTGNDIRLGYCSPVTSQNNLPIGYSTTVNPALFDYRTPLGTIYTVTAPIPALLFNDSNVTDTYTQRERLIHVNVGVPIYLFLENPQSSGRTMYVRNIRWYYDIV